VPSSKHRRSHRRRRRRDHCTGLRRSCRARRRRGEYSAGGGVEERWTRHRRPPDPQASGTLSPGPKAVNRAPSALRCSADRRTWNPVLS